MFDYGTYRHAKCSVISARNNQQLQMEQTFVIPRNNMFYYTHVHVELRSLVDLFVVVAAVCGFFWLSQFEPNSNFAWNVFGVLSFELRFDKIPH